jgi:phosphoglycerate dehydrogenase-like enzyme
MSEHLFAMLLALTRKITAIGRGQERRDWLHGGRGSDLRLTELRGKTMGILGWGKIGDGIAHLARAFGMRVVGTRWSVVVPREVPRESSQPFSADPLLPPLELPHDIVYPATQLHEVLAQSDFVVSLLPLTSETRGSIGETEFRAMKRGALFINLGRGPVVDEDALIRALQSGRLAGAGLDVFAHEPLPRSSPLWAMKNVIVSPHVGGNSDRTSDRAAHFFAVNLERYLKGQPLLNIVGRNTEY